jgi:DNA helicase HerA-like ATPase
VYGVVTDGFAYSDLVSPLHDVAGADGDPVRAAEAPTVRQEIRLWTAAVLRQEPEEPLQPVPLGQVFLAGDADVARALRMDAYLHSAQPTAVPVGLYSAGGLEAPVYLDADFLLGPEAAHLNISGVSGLATKTSAVEFLLASIFRHFPAHKGRVAAVCFNVKGSDLCFLDQPGALDEEDRRRYARLDVPPEPFGNVRYFAPFKADGVNLNTLRTHPDLAGDVEPLVWGLPEVLDFAEVLLNRDDIDAKADAFIDFLSDRVLGREFDDGFGRTHRVQSFADLDALFRSIMDGVEMTGRGDMWRTHHIATIRKVRNRLSNVSTRCKGLVADDGPSSDLPWGHFEDRAVYVIDIANVDPLGQDLVFARVVSKLREHLERRDLGVDTVVVFVDELNKYAPGEGPETYVKKMLLDISERGRYLGLVLFGAEQFRSQVHRRVVGNAGTQIFGRMDADELATPGYQVLSPATKVKLATLPAGELMVRHPHFTQPIFVRFPRPAVLRGRDGVERFPPAADLPFEDAVVRLMLRIDRGIAPNRVKDLIGGRRPEDVRAAVAAVRRTRPTDALAFFRRALGDRVAAEAPREREPVPPLSPIGDDPY